jgi:ABC-type glutathione transport system ATPase component
MGCVMQWIPIPMTEPLLKIENVAVDFRTATGLVRAVRGVSYDVARGET